MSQVRICFPVSIPKVDNGNTKLWIPARFSGFVAGPAQKPLRPSRPRRARRLSAALSPVPSLRRPGAPAPFLNSGGIREDIVFASSGPGADGQLTFGEAFGIQPFGNNMRKRRRA